MINIKCKPIKIKNNRKNDKDEKSLGVYMIQFKGYTEIRLQKILLPPRSLPLVKQLKIERCAPFDHYSRYCLLIFFIFS